MNALFTRRNVIFAVVSLAVIVLIALFARSALRGGGASIDGRTVQRIVEEDLLQEFSESLDVTADEARDLYEAKELEEAAEENDVTREEFLRNVRETVVAALQDAVEEEEITADQAEKALKMAMRAITNHL